MDLREDLSFHDLLVGSYQRLLGESLVPNGFQRPEAAKWLYESAPFGILAHNTAPDPIFVYGNRTAQRLFEYDWNEITTLPSRLSAEAPERTERQRFLDQVAKFGFVKGYTGIRVSKSGKRFRIENATVWQLVDVEGKCHGQAALLPAASNVSG